MVHLKMITGDNYRLNHPTRGWGLIRKGDVIEIDEGFAETLLKQGEQVREDLFVSKFEKVSEAVTEAATEKKVARKSMTDAQRAQATKETKVVAEEVAPKKTRKKIAK